MEEKYYLVQRVKNLHRVNAFNMDLLKQTEKNLEILTSVNKIPLDLGIKLNEDNKEISCINDRYSIKEITKEKAEKAIRAMNTNYLSWLKHVEEEKKL